ncbi:MAG: hypothetical protein R3C19_18560 [Planctomycetaceae bacterium]
MINRSTQKFGTLQCRVVDSLPSGTPPSHLVVLCHGFGAPGHDLVDLGPFLLESDPELAGACRFVFPEAPVDLAPLGMPGGRAWWPINMARLAEINQTSDYEKLTNVRPDGLLEASESLADAVKAMQQAFALNDASTVIGGFSQGAMVATDVALRHGIRPALLTLFSGTLLCRDEWTRMAAEHPGCPVFQSHGTLDPLLPFAPAEWLRDMLQAAGFEVEFQSFRGPHTIPIEALKRVAGRLTEAVARK